MNILLIKVVKLTFILLTLTVEDIKLFMTVACAKLMNFKYILEMLDITTNIFHILMTQKGLLDKKRHL